MGSTHKTRQNIKRIFEDWNGMEWVDVAWTLLMMNLCSWTNRTWLNWNWLNHPLNAGWDCQSMPRMIWHRDKPSNIDLPIRMGNELDSGTLTMRFHLTFFVLCFFFCVCVPSLGTPHGHDDHHDHLVWRLLHNTKHIHTQLATGESRR